MLKKYKIEGIEVTDNLTQEELKKVYRRLAQKAHPDRGGTDDDFKNLQNAYEQLRGV